MIDISHLAKPSKKCIKVNLKPLDLAFGQLLEHTNLKPKEFANLYGHFRGHIASQILDD